MSSDLREHRLEEMLIEWEELRLIGIVASATELCQKHGCPELETEIGARIAEQLLADQVLESPTLPPASPRHAILGDEASPGDAVATTARYRNLRLLDRGGMGDVFLADDETLGRSVALKLIQRRHADRRDVVERFEREVQVTSRLEHPGIVPVHGVGRTQDGRPCYSMRYIEGKTLHETIQVFHCGQGDKETRRQGEEKTAEVSLSPCPPVSMSFHSLAFRKLLGHFVSVCNTVAYAHNRGVIHRDLKPSNIKLGEFGETWVLDWGLARRVERTEPERETFGESIVAPPGNHDARYTVGIGTPGYMSPEQVVGPAESIGKPADIYALGAIIYEMLTGQPTLRPERGWESRVVRGDILRPRAMNAQAPAPLEAVCLKALALRPEDRYADAKELAREVENWLGDERVRAFRESLTRQIRRWMRRHGKLVAGAVAGLAVLTVSALISSVLLGTAYRNEEQLNSRLSVANTEVTEEKDRAEDNLSLAIGVVELYLVKITQSDELRAHGLQELRRELLQAALPFYERFLQQRRDEPDLEAERGRAYGRLAVLLARMGEREKAAEFSQEAIRVFERLVKAHPDHATYQQNLAIAYTDSAAAYQRGGHTAQAEAGYDRALALRSGLVKRDPDSGPYRRELAGSLYNLCLIYQSTNRQLEAEELSKEAIAILTPLEKDSPQETSYKNELANVHFNLGYLYQVTGRIEAAEQSYQRALDLRERLVKVVPANPDYLKNLAAVYHNLGTLYGRTKQLPQAKAAFVKALEWDKQLMEQHPKDLSFAKSYGSSCYNLGTHLSHAGDNDGALEWFARAIDTLKRVLNKDQRDQIAKEYLGRAHGGRAVVLFRIGRDIDALTDFDHALALHEGNRAELRMLRVETLIRLGEFQRAAAEAYDVGSTSPSGMFAAGAAALCARCSTRLQSDIRLTAAEREVIAEQFAVAAIELLRRAKSLGHFDTLSNLKDLREDADLEKIRSRGEVRQLLAELSAKLPPSARIQLNLETSLAWPLLWGWPRF
jgi:serine/threonine-protein kinase